MRYIINHKLWRQIEIQFGLHHLHEMAESSGDRSSLSSATDNESLYSSSDSLVSDDDGADRFPPLSLDTEVFSYRFEPEPSPEPSTDISLVTQWRSAFQSNGQHKLVSLSMSYYMCDS